MTVAVTGGLVLLMQRTTDAVVRQTGNQLARITEHALNERADHLDEIATVFAALRGSARSRNRAWQHPPLAVVAVLDRRSGRVMSALGPPLNTADLAAIAAAGRASHPVLRCADGLVIAGTAAAERGSELVVVAQRLDAAFATELGRTLQAEVRIDGPDGRPVAATFSGDAPQGDVAPARTGLATPGGGLATVTMFMPAGDVHRARRTALLSTFGGGLLLLLAAFAFYAWIAARVTRPIRELIAASERIAAGDLSAGLSADAPAELGALAAEFNRMAAALKAAQDKLVHSAKLSSVGALVAGVSHELNNPLYGLLGHAEHLAGKFPAGDPVREKLDTVVREARRMQRTLADLRGLTRPSTRERARVELGQVATEIVSLVHHDAETAGVTCTAQILPGDTGVFGSPDEVRQIVLNLVLNALQATPRGGSITVRTGGANGDRRCRLVVEDTGSGIAPEVLARVREPFFSTKPGRMGLGLSIAQELATAHDGRIEIESRPGHGTRMTVDLPVMAPAA